MLPMDDRSNKTKKGINPQSTVIGNGTLESKLAGFESKVCHLLAG